MSTNRPFFASFLSAFRARSGFQKASTSATGAVSGASLSKAHKAAAMSTAQNVAASSMMSQSNTSQGTSPQPTSSVSPWDIKGDTKLAGPSATSVSPVAVSYQRQHHHHHHHNSPGTSPGPSRGFRNGALSPTSNATSRRRGSDSSSEGFREIMGPEKWFIGGRTTAGEEKFYRLEMIRKPRSLDRLSADRLSI
jgi:hypothetical protein